MMQAITGYVREAAPGKTAPKKAAVATCRGAQLRLGLLLLLGTAAAAGTAGDGSPQLADAAFGSAGARAAAMVAGPPGPNTTAGAAVEAGKALRIGGPAGVRASVEHGSGNSSLVMDGGGANATRPASACTGKSVNLLQPQCEAWGDIFDATGGLTWIRSGTSCTKADPCSCGGITCNAAGTSVTQLCVPPLLPPPPHAAPPHHHAAC
jgi:hypothetical protein